MPIKYMITPKSLPIYLLIMLTSVSPLSAQSVKATNPVIFADVPDASMIRVGNAYYMSSTTMHMSPGVPIMKSTDLVNWKTIGYAYDTLASMDELNLTNGKSTYGRGSWASSIRYHKGTFYVTTFAQTTGRTHIYTTKILKKVHGNHGHLNPVCTIILYSLMMMVKCTCCIATVNLYWLS